jgi:mannose/fructose-specific phosphotransferase system component IIA
MRQELHGVVVAHAGLAEALIHAVEEISGVRGALTGVSNTDCDRTRLEERVREAIEGHPAVVFVDLPSGSCFVAAMRLLEGIPDVRVVSGVNLAMLLDFVFHRDETPEEAATRAGEVGVQAIAGR